MLIKRTNILFIVECQGVFVSRISKVDILIWKNLNLHNFIIFILVGVLLHLAILLMVDFEVLGCVIVVLQIVLWIALLVLLILNILVNMKLRSEDSSLYLNVAHVFAHYYFWRNVWIKFTSWILYFISGGYSSCGITRVNSLLVINVWLWKSTGT